MPFVLRYPYKIRIVTYVYGKVTNVLALIRAASSSVIASSTNDIAADSEQPHFSHRVLYSDERPSRMSDMSLGRD